MGMGWRWDGMNGDGKISIKTQIIDQIDWFQCVNRLRG